MQNSNLGKRKGSELLESTLTHHPSYAIKAGDDNTYFNGGTQSQFLVALRHIKASAAAEGVPMEWFDSDNCATEFNEPEIDVEAIVAQKSQEHIDRINNTRDAHVARAPAIFAAKNDMPVNYIIEKANNVRDADMNKHLSEGVELIRARAINCREIRKKDYQEYLKQRSSMARIVNRHIGPVAKDACSKEYCEGNPILFVRALKAKYLNANQTQHDVSETNTYLTGAVFNPSKHIWSTHLETFNDHISRAESRGTRYSDSDQKDMMIKSIQRGSDLFNIEIQYSMQLQENFAGFKDRMQAKITELNTKHNTQQLMTNNHIVSMVNSVAAPSTEYNCKYCRMNNHTTEECTNDKRKQQFYQRQANFYGNKGANNNNSHKSKKEFKKGGNKKGNKQKNKSNQKKADNNNSSSSSSNSSGNKKSTSWQDNVDSQKSKKQKNVSFADNRIEEVDLAEEEFYIDSLFVDHDEEEYYEPVLQQFSNIALTNSADTSALPQSYLSAETLFSSPAEEVIEDI